VLTEDYRVGREDLKVWMKLLLDMSGGASQELGVDKIYVEEVKLVGCGSNAVREEQNIPLQPGNFLRWILEACSWSSHIGMYT